MTHILNGTHIRNIEFLGRPLIYFSASRGVENTKVRDRITNLPHNPTNQNQLSPHPFVLRTRQARYQPLEKKPGYPQLFLLKMLRLLFVNGLEILDLGRWAKLSVVLFWNGFLWVRAGDSGVGGGMEHWRDRTEWEGGRGMGLTDEGVKVAIGSVKGQWIGVEWSLCRVPLGYYRV